LFLLLFLPVLTTAQRKTTRFEKFSSLYEIRQKAEKERKFVLINCTSSKSDDCRRMDTSVFVANSVDSVLSEKFLAITLPMDSINAEDEDVHEVTRQVRNVMKDGTINVFPTFLFFSPAGKLVHIGRGFKSKEDFVKMAADAINPSRQFFTLLQSYQQGRKDYPALPNLSNTARSLGNDELARSIAQDFINNYLLKLEDSALYRGDYMELAARYTGSGDQAFDLFFHKADKVDKVTAPGYSQGIVDYIITMEEIDPRLWQNGKAVSENPDWEGMSGKIAAKFGTSYPDRIIPEAKLRWYAWKKDWLEYCQHVIAKVDRHGPYGFGDKDFRFNGNAWDLFLHSTDKEQLLTALSWSDSAIKLAPAPSGEYYDTYANILYKLGRTREALKWEEKAVSLDPYAKDIAESMDKMLKREPTWPVR